MSLFGNLLEKLGIKRPAAQATPVKPAPTVAPSTSQAAPVPPAAPQVTPAPKPAAQAGPVLPAAAQYTPSAPPTPQASPAAPQVTPAPQPAAQAGPVPPAFQQFIPGAPPQAAPATPAAPQAAPVPQPAPVTPAVPEAIPVVDVVKKLDQLAAENPQKLNWKVSIVDLLKLLDLDSSFTARKELATELGCPADLMGDSAQMNTWLHKTVLQKIAENGGNIPKELLD